MKKNNSLLFGLIFVCLMIFSFSNCSQKGGIPKQPKYVFLFIGDGMGFAHVAAAEAYLADIGDGAKPGSTNISFTSFPVLGMATTYSANSYITCSSAAGTALSTGTKTNNNMLGVDPQGNNLRSITYDIKEAGYKVGIATSVSIDHATPAAFYANDNSRNNYYAIACQLPQTGFDFFAGSGFLRPKERDTTSINVYDIIQEAGYIVVRTPEQLQQIQAPQKIIITQEVGRKSDALTQAIDRTGNDGWTLPEITKAAIDLLNNPKGFFMMIEGGQIDWAAHSNDGAAAVFETIDFSDAVQLAIDFYHQHPDETLILVTADHETGGLTLGFNDTKYEMTPSLLREQKGKTLSRDEILELNHRAGFAWTTGAHTGAAVPVFAIGVGSEQFNGKMDNTDIPKRICKIMGIKR